jgi:hypothetical protein
MANNPFLISPPDPTNALQMFMAGQDRSQKLYRDQQITDARSAAGQDLANGGDTRGALAKLIGVGDAQTAATIAQLGKADMTDEIKEYNLSKAQGFTGSFTDWKTSLKKAGATNVKTSVSMGENEYQKKLGAADADAFVGYQKAGRGATSALTSLDVLERASQDPNFYSGAGAERFALPLKQVSAAFGGDPNAAASMETFRAVSSKNALDSMGGSLGAGFSNADRDFVLNQVPTLGNTPEGNKQLIDVNRKIERRKIDVAKLARDYASKNNGRLDAGFEGVLANYADKNPLFKGNAAPAPAGGSRTGTGVPWRIVQ